MTLGLQTSRPCLAVDKFNMNIRQLQGVRYTVLRAGGGRLL